MDKEIKEQFKGLNKQLSGLAANMVTKADLKSQLDATKIDLKSQLQATKNELKLQMDAQTKELKDYTHQAFEAQQVWMDERFRELIVKYDVRERVEKLEQEFRDFRLGKTVRA